MPNDRKWLNDLVRAEKTTLTLDRPLRAEMTSERTLINLTALNRQYKLGRAYANVRNLEYRSNRKIKLQTFDEYFRLRADLIDKIFRAEQKPRPTYPADEAYRNQKTGFFYPKGDMLVLVAKSIYDQVAASIAQYVLDVGRDGFWATIFTIENDKPADIRNFIKNLHPVGALLVGAIAAPWYEHEGAQFPCDLYYMDTNGVWTDPDGNGKFNDHTGGIEPEVWIGRLWTPTLNGNDPVLINDYFRRNHMFRLGLLGHAFSALAYPDDDWLGFDDCALDEMFPSSVITKYTAATTTDADLYKAEVNTLRSWVHLCAHSWTQGHALRVGADNEYIGVDYFRDKNPPNAHFYNLFCCGPGKYTEADYLAGWYIFDKTGGRNHGLTAVASAKSGSMLFFEDFYEPLGAGKTIGEAYVDWWKARGSTHEDWERNWFYGLVVLGDPTLTWWKGNVPHIEQPMHEDLFDHWPRKLQLRWDQVNVPGVKYEVELDAFGAVHAGQWAEKTNETFSMVHNLANYTYDTTFVGAQRGRWRVRAKISNTLCSWSPWSYFRFTV